MCNVVAILFAFNQERYVRDAVRDLLDQDIDALEVILSDDCSSDGTFPILQEEARSYRGRFPVTVRRNRRNLGLQAHINELVADTSADIVIPFAGDDRFHASRARRLCEAMQQSGALLGHSACGFIDLEGRATRPVHQEATFYRTTAPTAALRSDALFIGATAAWSRELFARYGPLPEGVYEDLVLGFRASLEGRIVHVAERLMTYRIGSGVSFADDRCTMDVSERWARRGAYLQRRYAMLAAHRNACLVHGGREKASLLADIDREIFNVRVRRSVNQDWRDLAGLFLRHPARALRLACSELVRSR